MDNIPKSEIYKIISANNSMQYDVISRIGTNIHYTAIL